MCVCVCACMRELSDGCTKRALCICMMNRTSLDWVQLFKNGLSSVIKLPGVMTPFLILSLSCPECGCDFSCSFIYFFIYSYRYVFKQMF